MLDPWGSSFRLEDEDYERIIREFGIDEVNEILRKKLVKNRFFRRKIIFGHRDLGTIFKAIEENKPVVALESTIISHGMQYPQNVETALKVEEEVRKNGAIPATIAIIKGVLKVGLTKDEIEYLGKEGLNVIKTSRRDLPVIVGKKLNGATTVATTMIIAEMAGIKVFATGGIGGVHRGAQETFDISADLQELARTNVAVVCAGAKSILDIGLTLEYLETNGVPVLGFQTKELPAFYTRKSGFNVDHQMDTPKEIADTLATKWDLNMNGGVVILIQFQRSTQWIMIQ